MAGPLRAGGVGDPSSRYLPYRGDFPAGATPPGEPLPSHVLSPALALVIASGVLLQILSRRLGIPAVVPLLVAGLALGPGLGWLDPDRTLGPALDPLVTLGLGIVLFEGGLSLRRAELQELGPAVRGLVTTGALVTWLAAAAAAMLVLEFPARHALLLGAVLVITGPTVVTPILLHVRLREPLGHLARWEAILGDPLGALLAVLVFELLFVSPTPSADGILLGAAYAMAVAAPMGFVVGAGLARMLAVHVLPDSLRGPAVLASVIALQAVVDWMRPEAGLLAVTVAGMTLASRGRAGVRHATESLETLVTVTLGFLFLMLPARITTGQLRELGWQGLLFLAVLILVVRPLAVLLGTRGTPLAAREKLVLCALAPRGVVAFAVLSAFGLRLEESGDPVAGSLATIAVVVVLGTTTVYGLLAGPLATWLGLTKEDAQGVLMLGAHPLALAMASVLEAEGLRVVLVDSSWRRVSAARMKGHSVFYGNVLSSELPDQVDLDGVGHLMALSPSDEENSLACLHLAPLFGRGRVYQLPAPTEVRAALADTSGELQGQPLFARGLTYARLATAVEEGARIRCLQAVPRGDPPGGPAAFEDRSQPLLVISADQQLRILGDQPLAALATGDRLVCLCRSRAEVVNASRPPPRALDPA